MGRFSRSPFLPTTLCDSPTMAILLGIGLSMTYFFLPVIGFHLRGRQACGAWAMLGFICFSLMVLEDGGLRYSAFSLHPDSATLGMLSAASLVLLGSGPSTSTTRLLAAGLLAGSCRVVQAARRTDLCSATSLDLGNGGASRWHAWNRRVQLRRCSAHGRLADRLRCSRSRVQHVHRAKRGALGPQWHGSLGRALGWNSASLYGRVVPSS